VKLYFGLNNEDIKRKMILLILKLKAKFVNELKKGKLL
jgi:hypothetical protein